MISELSFRMPFLFVFVVFSFLATGTKKDYPLHMQKNVVSESEYTIKPDNTITTAVSNKLMGFNLVYPHEADAIFNNGQVAGYLRDMNVAFLRYPGGTVCSYYHWNALTGEGWKDGWDPANPITPKSATTFMDIDEYMALVRSTGATPLVGVNMSSGWRWDRQQDGLNEAIALMQYCKDKNFEVEYWYLDNEPYQSDSNGGAKTPEQYADLVNAYAAVMKAFDPNIKIVVNWIGGFKNKRADYNKLIPLAGANIDVVDVHYYWSYSEATWEKWLEKTPMRHWTGITFSEDIADFRQMINELGFSNIKLASFEWNSGPTKGGTFTPSRVAMTQAEMMMQFISGGLDIGVFWPMHWPEASNRLRSLYNELTYTPNPNYQLFRFLGKMQGGTCLNTQIIKQTENMVSIAVQDSDMSTIRICVMNKNNQDLETDIQLDNFPGMKLKEAQIYAVNIDGTAYSLTNVDTIASGVHNTIKFLSKGYSMAMFTFEKLTCNLNIQYNHEHGTVTGNNSGDYDYGTTLQFTASPADGYIFNAWKINGEINESDSIFELVIIEDLIVEAMFTPIDDTGTGGDFYTDVFSMYVFPNRLGKGVEINIFLKVSSVILQDCRLLIYSMQGTLVKEMPVFQPNMEIPDIKYGLYIFCLEFKGKNLIRQKVVVE